MLPFFHIYFVLHLTKILYFSEGGKYVLGVKGSNLVGRARYPRSPWPNIGPYCKFIKNEKLVGL